MMDSSNNLKPELDQATLAEFAVHSPTVVQRLCKAMLSEENELYVFLKGVSDYFVTEMLDVRFDEGKIYLGTPYEKRFLNQCTSLTPYWIVAFPEGVKVQFEGKGMENAEFEGVSCLRINIPPSMTRIQRRNYFRIYADAVFRAQVQLEIDTLEQRFELLDFSLAGCGLNVWGHQVAHKAGHVFENVRMSLPENDHTMLLDIVVKNIKPSADSEDSHFYGCEIHLKDHHDEARLQRFLLATERRQRAASSSID
ncbi:flagellar brake protein [Limnobacter sp.]|uniref:flagellar brake protein n=1 Tax=Limnobacter sp. TaxID=2003368 RepID=UPI002582B1F8|nr:flagellar brake protein [Limnobacter sp.]